jgi:hypothetical protein
MACRRGSSIEGGGGRQQLGVECQQAALGSCCRAWAVVHFLGGRAGRRRGARLRRRGSACQRLRQSSRRKRRRQTIQALSHVTPGVLQTLRQALPRLDGLLVEPGCAG